MAGITQLVIGSFKSALSIPVSVTAVIPAPVVNIAGTTISLASITKAEMAEVLSVADDDTLDALTKVLKVLESIRLGIQVISEEELEPDAS